MLQVLSAYNTPLQEVLQDTIIISVEWKLLYKNSEENRL